MNISTSSVSHTNSNYSYSSYYEAIPMMSTITSYLASIFGYESAENKVGLSQPSISIPRSKSTSMKHHRDIYPSMAVVVYSPESIETSQNDRALVVASSKTEDKPSNRFNLHLKSILTFFAHLSNSIRQGLRCSITSSHQFFITLSQSIIGFPNRLKHFSLPLIIKSGHKFSKLFKSVNTRLIRLKTAPIRLRHSTLSAKKLISHTLSNLTQHAHRTAASLTMAFKHPAPEPTPSIFPNSLGLLVCGLVVISTFLYYLMTHFSRSNQRIR